MVNRLPAPEALSTSTVPPWAATMDRTRASPSPTPPASRFRAASSRTKGSKMRARSAGSMPIPVSWTTINARPSRARRDTLTLPPAGGVLDGIVHEVQHGAAEGAAFAEDGDRLDVLRADGHPRALGAAGAHLERFEHDGLEIEPVPGKADGRRGAREEQEILGHPDEEVDLLEGGVEDPPVFLRRAPCAKGHLHLTLEGGEGRAQLMRRVGREAARLGEGRLETRQHRVEGVHEVIDLILGPAPGQPPPQSSAVI
jgi:hypothetical protein